MRTATGAAIILFCAMVCQAAEWHRATAAECNAETERQLRDMADAGMVGDPPITMGFLMANDKYMIERSPCGYTDGSSFRPRYTLTVYDFWEHRLTHFRRRIASRTCALTRLQYESRPELNALIEDCKRGKLPIYLWDQPK